MPWDSSEVWVARMDDAGSAPVLGGERRVAGGMGSSVGQPRWCRDGSLLFVDDHRGWWMPHRMAAEEVAAGGQAEALIDRPCEFHAPDWVVGQSTMAANLLGSGEKCDQADGADGRSEPVNQAVTGVPV